ncbi:MAG: MgtC/SapB family protein [Clostridia bacterium]|nr:MgtC/SapB family protein [Clostridia bacterium]
MNIERLAAFYNYICQPNLTSAIIKLTLAVIFGAIIGIERGRKRRPAGLRTHMLVCLGSALTMVISGYLVSIGQSTDVSRLAAQVINGIGFLGAGSIIVTGRLEVKGLTTAAGLWASACMGLAIGAGFYLGAFVSLILIFITTTVMSRLEMKIMSAARNVNIYVEYDEAVTLGELIEKMKRMDVKIFDVELSRGKTHENQFQTAVFDIRLPKKMPHSTLIATIAEIESVKSVEEL